MRLTFFVVLQMVNNQVLHDAIQCRFQYVAKRTTPKIRAIGAVCIGKGLPADLFKSILGFIFMNAQDHLIHFSRVVIQGQIECAEFSRLRDENLFVDLPEQWAFRISEMDRVFFQSVNCRHCGQYKYPYPPDAPLHILCMGHI